MTPATSAREGASSTSSVAESGATRPLLVLVGNPNTGKTTVFNALTGASARVGNYPGITVERRMGTLRLDGQLRSAGAPLTVDVMDAPGAYSLTARSAEEQIAIQATLGINDSPTPQLVVVVVDAGQLVRNLYLVVQLVELRVPVVLALNMMDEVEDNPPDPSAITRWLGVPCVPTNARLGTGIDELRRVIATALADPPLGQVDVPYPPALRRDAENVVEALPGKWRGDAKRDRALAIWALASIDEGVRLVGIPSELRRRCLAVQAEAGDRDLDAEIIAARYALIDRHAPELFEGAADQPPKRRTSRRIDRILLHPALGFLIFIGAMLVLFNALFSWSEPAIDLVQQGVAGLQRQTVAHLPDTWVRHLLAEGLIGGVGNVLAFLPQILLLFLFIGLLEDSGYMARVAFLMDRIMRAMGLHGRAFVPMLSALACAVPAILATRTMERRRDRLLTMMVIPLVTCSARLPVYTLIIAALVPPTLVFGWLPLQGCLMVGMYVFSFAATLLAATALGRTLIQARRVPLILELPPYRVPSARVTLALMWERTRVFVKEAGTVILVATVVLWALLSYPAPPSTSTAPPQPEVQSAQDRGADTPTPVGGHAASASSASDPHGVRHQRTAAIENSYAGRLGRALEPVLRPLGFDWKLGVGIIGAFAAREVFVSTLALVYGMDDDSDADPTPLQARIREERRADGSPRYTSLVGLSLLVFFALSCQCMSTLAVVRRETRGWGWPAFLFGYTTVLAWTASFIVYQGGRLLGL